MVDGIKSSTRQNLQPAPIMLDSTAYDLVFAEFAINDAEVESVNVENNTELLLRSLLQLPSYPMVMYVEVCRYTSLSLSRFGSQAMF